MKDTKTYEPSSTFSIQYAYITREKGIRGGNAIISGTRIGVHDVIGLLQNGETVDCLVTQSFPAITRAQVYECQIARPDRSAHFR